MVPENIVATMREAGARAYPNEACGLVIGIGNKSIAFECRNIAPDPKAHFMIDPADYGMLAQKGRVVGVWHTHPDLSPQPSDADRAGCENTELPWIILGVRKQVEGFGFEGPVLIEPCGFEIPYLERPYVSGVLDCYNILLDFYKREYGIKLNDYPRIEADGRMGFSFFTERYGKEGFVRLIDQTPQPGDVFLIQTQGDTPNHIAVYLGDDMILHHSHNRLSRRDIYGGGFWQKHTTHHLRHKTKC